MPKREPSLTDKGLKAYEEHYKYHSELSKQILGALNEAESEQLLALIKKINNEIF